MNPLVLEDHSIIESPDQQPDSYFMPSSSRPGYRKNPPSEIGLPIEREVSPRLGKTAKVNEDAKDDSLPSNESTTDKTFEPVAAKEI
jgi:hypothetical protein